MFNLQTEYHGPCGPMVISNHASSINSGYPIIVGNESSPFITSGTGVIQSIGPNMCCTAAVSSGSGNTYNSRRSSMLSSDRSRGRDSVGFVHGSDIPKAITPWHKSILILFEVSGLMFITSLLQKFVFMSRNISKRE